MNKTFRIVWSESRQAYVVAHEKADAHGKPASGRIILAALVASLFGIAPAWADPAANALPTGGQIVAGSGSIASNGNAMTVNQATQQMIANWQSFDIGANASVQFNQPSASSIALNRILGQDPSQIFGNLSANGQVMLVNPAGIVLGPNSQVNVGALVASTLQISDQDFLVGNYMFNTAGGAGSIDNRGRIVTPDGGVVAFLAPVVQNSGSIEAPKGSTLLAAADKVTLDFTGDGLIRYTLDEGTADALAENSGNITADGGAVTLTAKAADTVAQAVVNNTGVIQARTLEQKNGRILLLSDMGNGEAIVDGTLDASAPDGGDGGFIETSAANVMVKDGVQITTAAPQGKTGEWLIDPVDITVAPSGGNVTGSAIATALQTTSVTLDPSGAGSCTGVTCTGLGGGAGNITVNDAIVSTGTSAGSLSLVADASIYLNAGITLTGNQAALSAKAVNNIITGEGSSGAPLAFQTNGGDITFWSYSTGAGTNEARIQISNYNTLSSGGGAITLAGGNTSATLASGTVVPTGYALANVFGKSGVQLGTSVGTTSYSTGVTINAGSGDVTIKGSGYQESGRGIVAALSNTASGIAISGATVTLDGKAGDYGWYGIELGRLYNEQTQNTNGKITISATTSLSLTGSSDFYDGFKSLNYWASGDGVNELSYLSLSAPTITIAGSGPRKSVALGGDITAGSGGLTVNATRTGTAIGTNDIYAITNSLTSAGDVSLTGNQRDVYLGSSLSLTGSGSDLQVKAGGSITLAASKSLVTSGGNVVLWADSDTTNGGGIILADNSSITTNGGKLVLAGGADNGANGGAESDGIPDGFAQRVSGSSDPAGVSLGAVTLTTEGGDVIINGKSGTDSGYAGPNHGVGSAKASGDTLISTGTGNITINAVGQGTGNTHGFSSDFKLGVTTTLQTTSGNISINGSGSGIANEWAGGIFLQSGTSLITDSGNISLTGQGGTTSHGTAGPFGIGLNSASILSASGAITLDGTAGSGGATTDKGIYSWGNTYLGQKTGTLDSSSSDITLTADTLVLASSDRVESTGNLTVKPKTAATAIGIAGGAGTLSLPASYFSTNFVNGFSGITVGSATAGVITANGFTFNDNLTLLAGNANADVLVNGNISHANGDNIDLLLKANRDIAVYNNVSIASTSGTMNVTLQANSGDGVGRIGIGNDASIASLGGNITLGGGSDLASGFAKGHATGWANAWGSASKSLVDGIALMSGASLNAGGGNISLRGEGSSASAYAGNCGIGGCRSGIYQNEATVQTSGTGTITYLGQGWLSADSDNYHHGMRIEGNNALIQSAAGAISLTGYAAVGYASYGVSFMTDSKVQSSSGTITIEASGLGLLLNDIGQGSLPSSSSDITLITDAIGVRSSASIQSSGHLLIQPRTASTTIGLAGGSGSLNLDSTEWAKLQDGFSSITVGRADGTGKITADAFTVNDNLTLLNTTGGIELTGALSGGSNTVTLNSTGTVTDTGSGAIAAGSLALLNASSVTLDSTSNDVGTLAATGTGALTYVDSNALTIGTVNPTGITATGPVLIETLTGDLTLSQNITTSDTSNSAIILNAGKSTAAGTATGGNILVSGGSVSVGSGGRATLYSGGVSGSTGLTTLIGSGSGNFRYNADENTDFSSGGWTALGTGKHAVYREQPTVTVTANDDAKTYDGSAYSGGNGVTYSGFVNGDTSASLGGTLAYGGTSQGATDAGSYTIIPSGYTSGLGYALNYANGTLTIDPAPVFIPPSPPPTTPPSAPSTEPLPVLEEGGSPEPGATQTPVPTTPTIAGTLSLGAGQPPMVLQFASDGDVLTLDLGGGDTTRSSTLVVFSPSGDGLQPTGALIVTEQGQSLSATHGQLEVASIPNVSLGDIRFVEVEYTLPDGGESLVSVGLSADGVLVIKVSAEVRAALDDRHLALIGLAIARQRLDVEPGTVKGVVILVS